MFPALSLLSERQQCAIWIKKLCDPATCPSGLTGRKNRNIYARLLLHMLRKGVLETPFTNRPEPGSLKILPTYIVRNTTFSLTHKLQFYFSKFKMNTEILMNSFWHLSPVWYFHLQSIYFEEPPSRRPVDQGAARLPEWVTGELGGFTDEALSLSLLKDRVSSTPVTAHHRYSGNQILFFFLLFCRCHCGSHLPLFLDYSSKKEFILVLLDVTQKLHLNIFLVNINLQYIFKYFFPIN